MAKKINTGGASWKFGRFEISDKEEDRITVPFVGSAIGSIDDKFEDLFREYLNSQYAVEGINFLTAIYFLQEKMSVISPEKFMKELEEIMNTYILKNATTPMNISSDQQALIIEQFQAIKTNLKEKNEIGDLKEFINAMQPAITEVESLIKRDKMIGFKKTEKFKEFKKENYEALVTETVKADAKEAREAKDAKKRAEKEQKKQDAKNAQDIKNAIKDVEKAKKFPTIKKVTFNTKQKVEEPKIESEFLKNATPKLMQTFYPKNKTTIKNLSFIHDQMILVKNILEEMKVLPEEKQQKGLLNAMQEARESLEKLNTECRTKLTEAEQLEFEKVINAYSDKYAPIITHIVQSIATEESKEKNESDKRKASTENVSNTVQPQLPLDTNDNSKGLAIELRSRGGTVTSKEPLEPRRQSLNFMQKTQPKESLQSLVKPPGVAAESLQENPLAENHSTIKNK